MKVYLILKIVGTNFDILNVCLTKKEANNFCSQLKKDLKNDGCKITKINNNVFQVYKNEQKIAKYAIHSCDRQKEK